MTMTNADELRGLLTRAARGDVPTHTELQSIALTGNIAERRKGRSELTSAVQQLGRLAGNPDNIETMPRRIEDIVSKFGGGSAESSDVSSIPRTYGTVSHRTGHQQAPERTPLTAMESALRHCAMTKTGLTDVEVAQLPIDPGMTAAQAQQWRTDVLASSMRVAEISESGHHADAFQAASEAAGPLSAGIKFPEPVDESEAARLPDGSYDPAALVANIRR